MGRRKIEIQPLSDERTKTVTFVKRKAGLFKKAYELSVLCDVDMAVIIVGNDRVYEYSSVDTKELMKYYKHKSPFELKLPEDYGEYKKRRTLKSGPQASLENEDVTDMNAESDYDSVSPEPKRQKKTASPASIYTKQPANSSFLSARKQPMVQAETQLQRPVLRVQIPHEANSQTGSTDTITPTDAIKTERQPASADALAVHPPPLNAARFLFNSKFRSPDSRKQMHALHVPLSKLQSLSPSTGAMPPLPANGAGAFYSTLPPPSPLGHYPPSILPTPVFNQVFNQQYMNQLQGMNGMNGMPLAPGMVPANAAGQNSMPNMANVGQMQSLLPLGDSGGGQSGSGAEPDTAKFKPPIPQQFMNGEQTPVSGLPSRYMNEIFPSPSNLYPSQEWPTGLTPYSSTMSHYFAGMPSANGLTPHTMNAVFSNNRTSLPVGQRPMPMRAVLSLNVPSQPADPDDQQLVNTATQPSSSEYMGLYFKKD